jgi:catechol 2,3-dioxygenase
MSPETAAPAVVGPVALRVASLARSTDFYRQALGLRVHREGDTSAALGAGGDDLLRLEEQADAPRPRGTTGLYHFALLLPSRRALAQQLWRLLQAGVRPQGVADHLVSEAIYLADPDGNGIELYRDRPRDEWVYDGGRIRMTTDPLDLDGLLAELGDPEERLQGIAPGTVMGHIHLRVSDVAAAEAFYRDVLGFDVTTRFGSSASFLSKGGYHHHIGLNTWESLGAPAPPEGALGLRHFAFHLSAAEVARARAAAEERGLPVEAAPEGLLVRDPAGNVAALVASTPVPAAAAP